MISRILGIGAFVCCSLVVLSFTLFARDQMAGASQHQQNELAANVTAAPSSSSGQHAQPRRFIDGAAGALTAPFRSVAPSDNPWVLHGLPTILALAVYGLGLGFLARYSRGT